MADKKDAEKESTIPDSNNKSEDETNKVGTDTKTNSPKQEDVSETKDDVDKAEEKTNGKDEAEQKVTEQKDEIKQEVDKEEQLGKDEGAEVEGVKKEDTEPSENTTEEQMDTDESNEKDSESESTKCYCNKERTIGQVELQCGFCMHIFHTSCVTCYLGKLIPFMTNYQFFCKNCNPNGMESFSKKQATFIQLCQTALANLMHSTPDKRYFSKEKEIIPFIDKHWEQLTTQPRKIKLTWHSTVAKTMLKEFDVFSWEGDQSGDQCFTLVNNDLSKIYPNYEALFKMPGSTLFKSDSRLGVSVTDGKTRGTKRKAYDSVSQLSSRQKKSDLSNSTKLSQFGYPVEHLYNKDGYRWFLAEADPHAPNRDAFEASVEWAGKAIPGYLYRTWLGNEVLLAVHDRAPQLKISDDQLTVTGEKGYSLVRATHGVGRGSWYFEVTLTDIPTDAATRIGWSQLLGNLQAPCGYDKFGYSWRSLKGTRFHDSCGKHYADIGYGQGDTVGFHISLPETEDMSDLLPKSIKDKPLVTFKNHLYFEVYVAASKVELNTLKGSKMSMYKNGKPQGVAFTDMYKGRYYPSISLYKNATIKVNFGPDFKYPPEDLKDFKPMSEAAGEAMVEHTMGDILFHIEHEDNVPDF